MVRMVAHLLQTGWLAMSLAIRRTATPRTCPRWVVCLLCLLAWRGPIPVLHCHEMEHAQTIEVARHVALYHDATSQSAGWHLHFILPDSDSAPGSEPDADSSSTLAWPGMLPELTSAVSHQLASAPLMVTVTDGSTNSLASSLVMFGFWGLGAQSWLAAPAPSSTCSRCASMFDGACPISPRALLCVARC